MSTDSNSRNACSRSLAAAAWAEFWELIDRQLSPLGLEAIETLNLQPGESVLDVGCGAGQTLLQLGERVGKSGRVIGVDVAQTLLSIARSRVSKFDRISLLEGDAEILDLPTASFDAVYSRFGVMAFADPATAFANLRRMLRPSGRLAFVCWRSLEENELDSLPLTVLGVNPAVDPTPFRFADPERLRSVLESAGFEEIVLRPHDALVSSGDLDAMVSVLLAVGSLGKLVREDPELRAVAEPRLRRVLAERGGPDCVSLKAAVWIVSARA